MKKRKYKIGISGRYGNTIELLTGQAVKTKILDKALRDEYGTDEIFTVDTYNWKKRPVSLFWNCIKMFSSVDNVVFLPAQGGVKMFAKLYLFLNKFYHRKLHYYVVGGWITEKIDEDKKLEECLKKLDGIYVELKSMQKHLEQKGFKNVFYVNKFRDINPIKKEEIPQDFLIPLRLCTFSRVMREKGIEEACEAVKNVNNHFGKTVYQLDIFGQVETEYQERFEAIKQDFPKYIHYCGEVDFEKSTNVLKNYYVLLFPTYYHGEGYPNTLVDAFAAGLPVVATNWKYNSEIIADGVDGIIYDYQYPQRLTDILIELVDQADFVKTMKENCIKRCDEYIPHNAIRSLIENIR